MDTLLVLVPTCYYVATEVMFGNPHVQHNPALHSDFVIYTYFRNERIFPSLWLAGVEEVIFNIFYPDRDDDNIIDYIGPWTIEVLMKGIRTCPDVCWRLFQSKAKAAIAPTDMRMVIFTLLTASILKINYHRGLKLTIFGLARLEPRVIELALKDDSFLEHIHTKPSHTEDVDS